MLGAFADLTNTAGETVAEMSVTWNLTRDAA